MQAKSERAGSEGRETGGSAVGTIAWRDLSRSGRAAGEQAVRLNLGAGMDPRCQVSPVVAGEAWRTKG